MFFEKIVTNKNIAESLAAVHATGCEPPVLKVHRTNSGDCRLADYQRDPDEPSITNNGRDFKLLRTISSNSFFFATVTFYAKPNFDEFFMYISTDYDAPAEILVRCHPASYDAYKETTSGTGLFDKKIYSGSAIISGNNYSLTIPIKTVFGNATANQVWLYDMTSQDRLPDPPILF
ncbi:MAG: hypothetical protein BWY65_02183 [Firmicutes bacterium ADurb.Bin373]|nr:MAG: hypothetical protein BWY65_02183 [Firmicutes bacterium ADurb.Bin373]